MTEREHKLRVRIDLLMDQRDELERQRDQLAGRLLEAEKQGRVGGWCVYCGTRVPFSRRACPAHQDLARLERVA